MRGKATFFIIVGLFSYQVQIQALKYEELAGFEKLLKKEFRIPLNPLCGYGFLRWGQQILQNLYEYGKGPLAETVRELFHHAQEDEILVPTECEGKAGFGLGPYETGWLLALVLTNPEAFQDPTPYQKEEKNKKKETTTTNTQSAGLEAKNKPISDIEKFINQVNITHKQFVQQRHPERKQNRVQGTSIKKLFALGNLASQACEKTKLGFYNTDFLTLLFNAFACAKSKEKKDLLDFIIKGFIEHLPQNILNSSSSSLDNDEKEPEEFFKKCIGECLTKYGEKVRQEQEMYQKFLKKYYSSEMLKLTPKLIEEESPLEMAQTNPLFFPGLAYMLSLSSLPDQIVGVHINKYDASDCTEATILHVLAAISYDKKNANFTTKHLPEKIKPTNDLNTTISFLNERNPNHPIRRTWWFEFLGGRPSIEYRQEKLEVRASNKNIFTLLNQIFGTTTTSWEEFGKTLSSATVTFEIKGPELNAPPTGNDLITIKKRFPDGVQYQYAVKVTHHQHAAIIENTTEDSAEQRKSIVTKLMVKGLPYALYASLLPVNNEMFSAITRPHKSQNEKQFFLILSKNLKNRSFFELYRLFYAKKELLELINMDAIKPGAELFFTDEIANWLIQQESYYTAKQFQPYIRRQATTFAAAALFYQRIDPIIDLLKKIKNDTKLSNNEENGIKVTLSESDIEKNIRSIWVNLLRYWCQSPETYQLMNFLMKNFPHSYNENAKVYALSEAKSHKKAIEKFVQQDIHDGIFGKKFTQEHPHMLYLLADLSLSLTSNKEVKSTMKKILKSGGTRYLQVPILEEKNIFQFLSDETKNHTSLNKPKYPLSNLFALSSYLKTLQTDLKKKAQLKAVVPYGSINNPYQNLIHAKKPKKKKSFSLNMPPRYKILSAIPRSDSSSSDSNSDEDYN